MKILFLLHALLKEIQEYLSSYQSQEFFAAGSMKRPSAGVGEGALVVATLQSFLAQCTRWQTPVMSRVPHRPVKSRQPNSRAAQKLKALLAGHQGLLIATPEHNGGYTALLKNGLDRMSRPNGFPPGKVAALISASPGLLGGVKSQLSLQIVLTKLGVHVIPDSFAFGAAHQAFGAEGGLRDATAETAVRDIGAALTGTLDKFAGFGHARSAAWRATIGTISA